MILQREAPGLDAEARVLAEPTTTPEGSFVIVAGASTGDRDEALAGIVGAFAVGVPLALLIASALGYLLASRSLAPVESMRRRAAEITLERSGERPLPRADDEIRRLAETLNRMLDRIEASLERQRVFVADASHELRTPLAVLRPSSSWRSAPSAAATSSRPRCDRRPRRSTGCRGSPKTCLVVARSGLRPPAAEARAVDLGALLSRTGERFEPRAAADGREVGVDAPKGLEAELDVLRIEQAVGNLVDNALRHGDGDVRVSARRDDGLVVVEVADEGGGFPQGFAEHAFERFTRADDGRTGGGAGPRPRDRAGDRRRARAGARRSRTRTSPRPSCVSPCSSRLREILGWTTRPPRPRSPRPRPPSPSHRPQRSRRA